MIRIRTPSRLHFGLFSAPAKQAAAWNNQEGQPAIPRRHYGGVGLMIHEPGIALTVEPAAAWHAEGPLADRALAFAKRFCVSIGSQKTFHLAIASAAREHAGLGTGTQLGLAVAHAIARLTGSVPLDAVHLAAHVGRGLRSAVGIHGFERGGFLVEGGKTARTMVAPLLFRHDFPDDWHIMLITPRDVQGAFGTPEIEAFADLAEQARDDRVTDSLTRIVLLGMLPALLEQDLTTFGEAVYDFNRRVGTWFQSTQGGIYAHPRTEQIIKLVREAGIKGVGQTSWGPTVFALVPSAQSLDFQVWMTRHAGIEEEEVIVAHPCNRGCAENYSARGQD